MKYELAKQLKDAGFPQEEPNGFVGILNADADPNVYFPSLEELIEACGPQFEDLRRVEYPRGATEGYKPRIQWEASTAFQNGNGSTPTEAVANLWLVLNAK